MTWRDHGMRTTGALVLFGSLVLLPIRSTLAAPACATSCSARMAACRAERCPTAKGNDRRHCRDVCRAVTGCAAGAARIRTMATIVNRCRAANGSWTVAQHLEIRRGDCAPITMMAIEGSEPVVDFGACALYGQGRQGGSAEVAGVLHRVAVSPDARTIVFELTDDFTGRLVIDGTPIPTPPVELATEGIFVVRADGKEGTGLLQLTNFDRSDTQFTIPLRDRAHIVVGASADPLHENPWNTCQLFSVDRLGGHLRQLTHFDPGATAPPGCAGGAEPPGCTILSSVGTQDRSTGAIIFDSSCDPFGVSAVSQELFAVRPNGTGFRQLTAYRGTTSGPGGTVDVELPGPISYQRPH